MLWSVGGGQARLQCARSGEVRIAKKFVHASVAANDSGRHGAKILQYSAFRFSTCCQPPGTPLHEHAACNSRRLHLLPLSFATLLHRGRWVIKDQ
jgi:hypothetical protein